MFKKLPIRHLVWVILGVVALFLFQAKLVLAKTRPDTSFVMTPAKVMLRGKPGETVSQIVQLTNKSPASFLLKCSFTDLWYDGEEYVKPPLGTISERQAGKWSRCVPNQILIGAHQKQGLKFVATIPKDAEGDYFSMLYASAGAPEEALEGAKKVQLSFGGQLGIPVILTAAGTEQARADIKDVKVKSGANVQELRMTVHNQGNVMIKGQGTLIFTRPEGGVAGKTSFPVKGILPGQSRKLQTLLTKPIHPGNYQVLFSVLSPRGSTLTGEFTLQVQSY